MRRRSVFSLVILSTLLLFPLLAQRKTIPLRVGDTFPRFYGSSLTGKQVEIPVKNGQPIVVLFSFSRAGGNDARLWNESLTKDVPALRTYTIILLESVPKLFRGMALSGIRNGIPPHLQVRTEVSYQDEDLWKGRLAVQNDGQAYVVMLRADGQILWMNSGAFSNAAYSSLKRTITDQFHALMPSHSE